MFMRRLARLAIAGLLAVPQAALAGDNSIADRDRQIGIDLCRAEILQIGNRHYPKAATAQGLYGSVQLTATVSDTGEIVDIHVDRSSGSAILDDAAAEFIRLAAPCRIISSQTSFTRTFVFQQSQSGDLFHDHQRAGPGKSVFSDVAAYAAALKRRIRVPSYRGLPRSAKALIELTLSPTGVLDDAAVRKSSGFALWDKDIIQAVRTSQPFPVMEEWLAKGEPQKINLTVRPENGADRALTGEEIAAVKRLSLSVEHSCLSEQAEALAQLQKSNPGSAAFFEAMDLPKYCSCLRDGIVADGQLVVGFQFRAEVKAFMEQLGSGCAATALHNAFRSDGCRSFARSFAWSRGLSEQGTAKVCACVDQSIARLGGAEFIESLRNTTQDVQDWKREGPLSSFRPYSLLPEIRSCLQR